jgi:hypothetical protein
MCVEIKKYLLSASKCFHGLKRPLKLYLCLRETKPLLYKVLIRPVVTYASETWVIAKKGEETLGLLERRIFRSFFGAVQEAGQ